MIMCVSTSVRRGGGVAYMISGTSALAGAAASVATVTTVPSGCVIVVTAEGMASLCLGAC